MDTRHLDIEKLMNRVEKQAWRIDLLEQELKDTSAALEEKCKFAAALEQDLEHAIAQLEQLSN